MMEQGVKQTGNRLQKRTYGLLIAAVYIIIVAVLGFTAVLNVLSFKQSYEDSLTKTYSLAGQETVKKVEEAIKYGKVLDRFYGMTYLLREFEEYLPGIENVYIVLPDGRAAYDLRGSVRDKAFEIDLNDGDKQVILPIHSPDRKIAGTMAIVFDGGVITSQTNDYIKRILLYMFILSLVSVALVVTLIKIAAGSETGGLMKRAVLLRIVLSVLAVVQIVFGYVNYGMFKAGYMDITGKTASMVLTIIQRDVETVIDRGVPYSRLNNLEDYFAKISEAIPQIDKICLGDSSHEVPNPGEYLLSAPLKRDSQGSEPRVDVILSGTAINSSLREILLDGVTIMAVSFFLMIEITLMVSAFAWKRLERTGGTGAEKAPENSPIRSLAFVVYGAVFMTAAFVPVIMNQIYQPLFGLPKDIVLALPISLEMLCGLTATLAAGSAIDRKGWKSSFVLGIALFMTGTVLSGLAHNPLHFTAARGLCGAGFGLMVMAMRTLVISAMGNTGIADMNAGAVAGINCGVVSGAMMADRIGFASVFYISAALAVPALLFAVRGIENLGARDKSETARKASLSIFWLDKQVLSFFCLVLIPFSIGSMFLNYYFPLYANGLGISSSNVGRAFMLNGLCIVYLGPLLSKYFESRLGSRKTLVTAVTLTAFSFLLFAVSGSIAASFAALLLMGVSDSFGVSAQIGVYLNSKGVKELGEVKAIAYYSLVGKLGQMLGPIIYGTAAVLGNTKGIGIIGIGVLLSLMLFVIVTSREKMRPDHGGGG